MSVKIKAVLVQEMVSKSVKGASNNKMLPITSLMEVRQTAGEFVLTTTDGTNYLYVREHVEDESEFVVVVPVEQFSKLISKITSEYISLNLEDSCLTVTGNGTYKIQLPLDENGSLVKYPNPYGRSNSNNAFSETEVSSEVLKSIVNTNKVALPVTLDVPSYSNYYIGTNAIVTTDTYKICRHMAEIVEAPILVSPQLMNLVEVFDSEPVTITCSDDEILMESKNITICGVLSDGIEEYAIDAINGLIDEEFNSMCKLSKDELLLALDRISLFIEAYDKNSVSLTFSADSVTLSSKLATGTETLDYIESKNAVPYTCDIDITMLQSQLKSQVSNAVNLYYGQDKAIKLVEDNVTRIVALLEDE